MLRFLVLSSRFNYVSLKIGQGQRNWYDRFKASRITCTAPKRFIVVFENSTTARFVHNTMIRVQSNRLSKDVYFVRGRELAELISHWEGGCKRLTACTAYTRKLRRKCFQHGQPIERPLEHWSRRTRFPIFHASQKTFFAQSCPLVSCF